MQTKKMADPDCEYCHGTGLVEKAVAYRSEPNVPVLLEGTGVFEECKECEDYYQV